MPEGIVLKKEVFDKLRKELLYLLAVFGIAVSIFKIVFYKEDLAVLLRNVASIFWLLVLPGHFLMFYWEEKLGFLERIVAGTAFSAALIGITSYYVGLSGINIKYHAILLPSALLLIGLAICYKKLK